MRPGELVRRHGDEIIVAGQLYRVGTPVVLWMDPGGYDAYRVERRFVTPDARSWSASSESLKTPNRFGLRGAKTLDTEQMERLRGGGWDLDSLREVVDQFVIHYDACGTSRECFRVLHDLRGLSVHFMLDLDGTIYQTLDAKERAWHAAVANDRSIGIEIANIGAYSPDESDVLNQWYARDTDDGRTHVTLPSRLGDGGIRTPGFQARPVREDAVEGNINGELLRQYDLTSQQYAAMIKLTAAISRIFPKIKPQCPRDSDGNVLAGTLDPEELENFQGLVAHYHITTRKIDPGPAFQWDRVLEGARRELGLRR